MSLVKEPVLVVGGGLAGCEAAWQIAERGTSVVLYEMRPVVMTPAHQTDKLAELVCSNSLGSDLVDRASGLLKEELRRLGSFILSCADAVKVPAGDALAVGREAFSSLVTERILSHPCITVCREEIMSIPSGGPVVIATGPLTSPQLANAIRQLTGSEHLFFYDAMAPIVTLESIDMNKAFRSARYGRGVEDYINCPLNKSEYDLFVDALVGAETFPLHDFELKDAHFFEACLPVEVMARRGRDVLAFGPLKPVGLIDPRSGKRPYAVVQLRQDNLAGTLYNIVGFQTNLLWREQERVFRMIPGLEQAEFVRYGQMHRNTFIDAPRLLRPTLQLTSCEWVFFGGQITGTEGYVASVASGYVAGLNASRLARGLELITFPPETMIGALLHYITTPTSQPFQPMKPNFGIMPALPIVLKGKRERGIAHAERSLAVLSTIDVG